MNTKALLRGSVLVLRKHAIYMIYECPHFTFSCNLNISSGSTFRKIGYSGGLCCEQFYTTSSAPGIHSWFSFNSLTAPSHYLNHCWNIVNWTLRKKLQWNLNRNWNIFIQEKALENVVWKMTAILSRPQCLKDPLYFNIDKDHWCLTANLLAVQILSHSRYSICFQILVVILKYTWKIILHDCLFQPGPIKPKPDTPPPRHPRRDITWKP